MFGNKKSRYKRRLIGRLLEETGYRCCFCLCRLDRWSATKEHIIPKAEGGTDSVNNLTVSCYFCNHTRGDEDFYEFEARTPKRPDAWASPHHQKRHQWWAIVRNPGEGCR